MEKKLDLKKNSLYAVVVFIAIQLLIILTAYYSQLLPFDVWINRFSILLIINLISTYYIFFKLKIKFIGLFSFSIALTYLFHFGQIITLFINPFFYETKHQQDDFLNILESNVLQISATFSLLVVFLIVLGGIFYFIFEKPKKLKGTEFDNKQMLYNIERVGWLLLIICFPIQVYIDYSKFNAFVNEGYLAVFESAVNGYVGELGQLSFTAFAMLILVYSQKNRNMSFFLFFIANSYLILTMSTGSRGKQLTVMLLYLYLFHHVLHKINWKSFFLVSLIGVLLLNLLSTIALFRAVPNNDIAQFLIIYKETFKNSPVLGLVYELGGTIQTVYQTIRQVPNFNYQGNGLTYLTSWLTILPNIGSKMSEINESAHFVKNIGGSALGGSIVGELFYNFRFLGAAFAPIVGFLISKISKICDDTIEESNYYKFSFMIPLFVNILWWTRDAFVTIPRAFLFNFIVLTILYKFMNLIKKKNF